MPWIIKLGAFYYLYCISIAQGCVESPDALSNHQVGGLVLFASLFLGCPLCPESSDSLEQWKLAYAT